MFESVTINHVVQIICDRHIIRFTVNNQRNVRFDHIMLRLHALENN